MAAYTLPDLSYDFGALEPHLSGQILELHHGKHHAAYVQGANTALEKLDQARRKAEFASVAALERTLAFNLSGHVLHSLFWMNLTPKGGGRPGAEFGAAMERDFGGFEPFKRQFIETAATIMGSGWAALVWEPLGRRLLITQIFDHQANVAQGSLPIMVLDAWEHAYYLQYQNRKTEFFEAIWNVWNWRDIERRFLAAQTA